MTSKERVHAALEGKPVDGMPVAALYCQLYHLDHFAELTGRPAWELHRWLCVSPEEHLALFRQMIDRAPFEILQPQIAPSREDREHTEFVLQGGQLIRCDKRRGTCEPVEVRPGHPIEYRANETQHVFTKRDADVRLTLHTAREIIANGQNDYVEAAVRSLGRDHFILSGGVVGTIFSLGGHLGQTNSLRMLVEQPDLIEHLCKKIVEQNIETIRALAAAGGDAIYVDDATATSDMISVAHFERFSLPYMKEMVREIHGLGLKAIIIYFGGVADRLDQLAGIGADGLLVEASMKGYVNDIDLIAERIGDRVSLFGSIDPIGVLQKASDEQLEAEIARQAAAGHKARGFILSPASPITPFTPLARVQRFIELCKRHGSAGPPPRASRSV